MEFPYKFRPGLDLNPGPQRGVQRAIHCTTHPLAKSLKNPIIPQSSLWGGGNLGGCYSRIFYRPGVLPYWVRSKFQSSEKKKKINHQYRRSQIWQWVTSTCTHRCDKQHVQCLGLPIGAPHSVHITSLVGNCVWHTQLSPQSSILSLQANTLRIVTVQFCLFAADKAINKQHDIQYTVTHTYTVLTATFSGKHGLAGPRAGSRVVRIDPLCFLAGCRTRRLNQALSVLSLSLSFFSFDVCVGLLSKDSF